MYVFYASNKVVQAKPESNPDYPDQEGYTVLRNDGHESWWPKAAFEKDALILGDLSRHSEEDRTVFADAALVKATLDKYRSRLEDGEFVKDRPREAAGLKQIIGVYGQLVELMNQQSIEILYRGVNTRSEKFLE